MASAPRDGLNPAPGVNQLTVYSPLSYFRLRVVPTSDQQIGPGALGISNSKAIFMLRSAVAAVFIALATIGLKWPAAAQADARTSQLRLLCTRLSGDLTDPGGMASFRRCMNQPPVAALRQNAQRPKVQTPLLYNPTGPLAQ
jgi:hypothetical protein